jgi:hypothetical protein
MWKAAKCKICIAVHVQYFRFEPQMLDLDGNRLCEKYCIHLIQVLWMFLFILYNHVSAVEDGKN